MYHIIAAVVSVLVLLSTNQRAAIADAPGCTQGLGGTAIQCEGNVVNDLLLTVGDNGYAGATTTTNSSNIRYVPYNRLSTGPDGTPCVTTAYVREGTTPSDELLSVDPNPLETNIPITGNNNRILETYPPCPAQPRAPGQQAPMETKAMVAARFWNQVLLPKPTPEIDPGRAITGKLAYLETHGQISLALTKDTESFGLLQIVARGKYEVNWGDGVTTKNHHLEGQPWPNGQITHEYSNVGIYNVEVTEYWDADWQLDGESGRLNTLRTTGRINNFPVEQLQAVIGR